MELFAFVRMDSFSRMYGFAVYVKEELTALTSIMVPLETIMNESKE